MLLGTLGASLLGNMLAEKWINRAGYGNKADRIIRLIVDLKRILNSASSCN